MQQVPRSSTSGSEAPPAPHGPGPAQERLQPGVCARGLGLGGLQQGPISTVPSNRVHQEPWGSGGDTQPSLSPGRAESTGTRPASWWIQTFLTGISHRLFPKKAKPGPLTSLQPPPGFVMHFLSSHPRRFSHQSHSSSSEHSKQQPCGVPQPPASSCLWVTAYTAMEGPRQPCCKRRLKNPQWVPNHLSTMPLLSISLLSPCLPPVPILDTNFP